LQLPGIGKYSASAILAFAYSIPTVFVETNIRSVFTYFFSNGKQMADNRMHDLVAATVDIADPRKWYYALFDYGAMLKKTLPPAQRIKEKKTQAPFHGSDRQIRGAIVRKLISNGNLTEDEIIKDTLIDKDRAGRILDRLQQEGFIARDASSIKLAGG
jgi:A/G-specific adenine glycosylase